MVVKQLGVCTCMHIHTFVFGCRADRHWMGVPYSQEDSSGWPVCCLPAAYTPAIHLLLPGPSAPLSTHIHTARLTIVSVCIVMLYAHKSWEVEGAWGWSTGEWTKGVRSWGARPLACLWFECYHTECSCSNSLNVWMQTFKAILKGIALPSN